MLNSSDFQSIGQKVLNTQRKLARNESIDNKSSTNELIISRNFDSSPVRTYRAQQSPFES